jgi:hypothetical protein
LRILRARQVFHFYFHFVFGRRLACMLLQSTSVARSSRKFKGFQPGSANTERTAHHRRALQH